MSRSSAPLILVSRAERALSVGKGLSKDALEDLPS